MPPKYCFIEKDAPLTHQKSTSKYMPIGAKSFISLFLKWICLQFGLIKSAADLKYCNLCEKQYINGKLNSDHVVGFK